MAAVASSLMSPPKRWKKWSYRLFGPTSLHLRHEFYLWVSLSLLTMSSLQGVYRLSFGTVRGDYIFCAVASAWLSRHLIVRWLVTSDTSTNASPSLLGLAVNGITSLILAGQYCDRPESTVVGRHLGITPVPQGQDMASLIQSHPGLTYALQFLRLRIWYPILKICERIRPSTYSSYQSADDSVSDDAGSRRDRHYTQSAARSWEAALHPRQWLRMWMMHGPPLQLCFTLVIAFLLVWYGVLDGGSSWKAAARMEDYEEDRPQPRGIYRKLQSPTWTRLFLYLASGSTLASIILYGRVLVPIVSLVAGSNVLPSVRNEAKVQGGTVSSKGTRKYKGDHHHAPSNGTPWADQYKSIATENRFRLFCKVTMLRVLDAIVVCVLVPRTAYACRATGHCPARPQLWELAGILNPAGLTGPVDATPPEQRMFAAIATDRVAALVTLVSVVAISVLLLLAQLVTLNKSYLAIMGYISGEWTKVQDTSSVPKFGSSAPTHWDPRRRYKKGDMILHNPPGLGAGGPSVYKATSNSPEGPPFDLFLRATHDWFRNELGHPSTSHVIAMASRCQMILIGTILAVMLYYHWIGYPTNALWSAFVANSISAYAITQVGLTDHSELNSICQQISVSKR